MAMQPTTIHTLEYDPVRRQAAHTAIVNYLRTEFPEDAAELFAHEFIAELDELLDMQQSPTTGGTK